MTTEIKPTRVWRWNYALPTIAEILDSPLINPSNFANINSYRMLRASNSRIRFPASVLDIRKSAVFLWLNDIVHIYEELDKTIFAWGSISSNPLTIQGTNIVADTANGSKGLLIEKHSINYVTNPILGDGDTGYEVVAGATKAVDSSRAFAGASSLRVSSPGVATGEGIRYGPIAVLPVASYLVSLRVSGDSSAEVNYAVNPGFEIDASGWIGSKTPTRVTTDARFGVASLAVPVATEVDDYSSSVLGTVVVASPNQSWTLRLWAKSGSPEFVLRFRNSIGASLIDIPAVNTGIVVSGWTQYEITGTAPANTVDTRVVGWNQSPDDVMLADGFELILPGGSVRMIIQEFDVFDDFITNQYPVVQLSDSWRRVVQKVITTSRTVNIRIGVITPNAIIEDFWIDALQLEQDTVSTTHIHGDRGTGFSWQGTPHQSPSEREAGLVNISASLYRENLGSQIMYLDPSNGSEFLNDSEYVIFSWEDNEENGFRATYDGVTDTFTFRRSAGGEVSVAVTDVVSFEPNTPLVIILGWDLVGIHIQVNVGSMARASVGNTFIPNISNPLVTLGRVPTP